MNKEDAITALEQGKRVRHESWKPIEWIEKFAHLIRAYNGINFHLKDFLESAADEGWEIVD